MFPRMVRGVTRGISSFPSVVDWRRNRSRRYWCRSRYGAGEIIVLTILVMKMPWSIVPWVEPVSPVPIPIVIIMMRINPTIRPHVIISPATR